MAGGNRGTLIRLRPGDRVRSHFQNRLGERSSGTDVGTLLRFTTGEAEVQFDDGAVQCVSKTWITERLVQWDFDVAVGDLVHAHYVSGKGRTSGTDLGVVLDVLDGGRLNVRYQDNVTQTIPMGWVEQVMRLQAGDRAKAHFKTNDGRGGKSLKTDVGTVLHLTTTDVHLVFDDRVEQTLPKTWVVQRIRAWDLQPEVGQVADVHFEVGEERRRSIGTDVGIVTSASSEGRVAVQFQDGAQQMIPMGWIGRLRKWGIGDRVQSHFKTGGGEKSIGTDVATVLMTTMLEVELYFDDGVVQSVSKAWVADRIRDWCVEVPEVAIGDVVAAHFKRPGNQCRSAQMDRGVLVSMMPRGQVSIKFQDDITQVIPKGWIEAVVTRWSGDRAPRTQPSQAETGSADAGANAAASSDCKPKGSQKGDAAAGSDIIKPRIGECVVCMDARCDAVIVHGETCHQSTCFRCAKHLQHQGDPCPICREPIDTVCKHHGEYC